MIVLAFDPGTRLGWATNSTAHHRGFKGVFNLDEWVAEWYGSEVADYSKDDLLARRLASARRIADSTLAHVIKPDLIVVERQLTMAGKLSHVNRDIEKVLIELAGYRESMLLRPTPSQWQAWAKKRAPTLDFDGWVKAGKPDDYSAYMMLQWALATAQMEAA